jgi:hypothetical protein
MHLSDTLVIGPLPLQARPVRVPLGTALAVSAALLIASGAAAVSAPRLLATALAPLAARMAVAFPALAPVAVPAPLSDATEVPVRLSSAPAGATIVADGQSEPVNPDEAGQCGNYCAGETSTGLLIQAGPGRGGGTGS